MMCVWSYLRQFTSTQFVIVTDADIDVRDWAQVIWAVSTRVDPARDSMLIENTPIDYLDFASPVPGLGSKLGLDATHKWRSEERRVGKECVSTCRSRWSPYTLKKNKNHEGLLSLTTIK